MIQEEMGSGVKNMSTYFRQDLQFYLLFSRLEIPTGRKFVVFLCPCIINSAWHFMILHILLNRGIFAKLKSLSLEACCSLRAWSMEGWVHPFQLRSSTKRRVFHPLHSTWDSYAEVHRDQRRTSQTGVLAYPRPGYLKEGNE